MPKGKMIVLRVTEEEKARLEEYAEGRGLTVSQFLLRAAEVWGGPPDEGPEAEPGANIRALIERAQTPGGGGYDRLGKELGQRCAGGKGAAELRAAIAKGERAAFDWLIARFPELGGELPRKSRRARLLRAVAEELRRPG